MKTIVVYYSQKGSNKYLAEKIANSLSCEIEEIKPILNVFFLFLMNIHLGIRLLVHNIKDYDRVILCGPIWMGKLVPPLRSFLNKYFYQINSLVFVTCCGSTYAMKDEKFGHGLVFKEVESIIKEKCVLCQAFPIGLVLPDGHKDDTDAFMKAHLNNENFKGEMLERYESFLLELNKFS